MTIEVIPGEFSVCKTTKPIHTSFSGDFYFIAHTDGEFSFVCRSEAVPAAVHDCSSGWNLFRVQGTLDFSLVGVLARISGILAENGVSIFAVSTFNTDYVLTKERDFENALRALETAGFIVKR